MNKQNTRAADNNNGLIWLYTFWQSTIEPETMSFQGPPPPPPGFNPSLHKRQSDSDITEDLSLDQEVQVFAKQLLVNRLFLGHYQERRLVESLKSYRDVVVVSNSEKDLKRDLETVWRKLKGCPKFSKVWIGITGPELVGAPAGQALWLKLNDLAFGQYWFQIKQVKYVEGKELYLRLKCVRAVDTSAFTERGDFEPAKAPQILDNNSECPSERSFHTESSMNWDEVKGKFKANVEEGAANIVSLLTYHNAKEVIVFTAVLITACMTGLFHSLRYLGDYTLRFMREFSYIIRATTPIFLAIIDFFTKLVGGFYLLIAMMWRTSRQPQAPPLQFQSFMSPPRAIEMPRKWQRR